MGNLIRAEFYRIRCQRWGFYGLTGSVLGGVVLLTLLCAFPPQSGDAALLFQTIEYSAIVGMVLAVPCADLASARVDGRQVLLKNEAVFGIPRWQMYLSRLFTALLLGVGLGQSRQKYLYLPEPQNDFIFAVVCEELGMVGALVIIVLFAMLIWRGVYISVHAKDKFGMLLGLGITFQVGLQTVLNICVVTNTIPNTGISLPFFSYGGTALLMLLGEMGVLLNISRSANVEKT